MKKEKYLQIFNYLLEFSKLRSKPVRNIESSDTQYPNILWFADIPQYDIFDCITFPSYNQDADYWLKIIKPKNEPQAPTFPKLSDTMTDWIDTESLKDENGVPILKETILKGGKTILLTDKTEIEEEFQEYLNQIWIDDLEAYKREIENYEVDQSEYDKQSIIYKQLFSIYNKAQQFGEEFELIVGVGLLHFQENLDTPLICRHILTSKAEITFEFSARESYVKVSPSIENEIQIETDAILDLFEQFDTNNIIEAEKKVLEFLKEKNISDNPFDSQIKDAIQIFADRLRTDGQSKDDMAKSKNIPIKPTVYFAPALLLRKRNTRSFTALYKKIIDDISISDDLIDIPSINDIIGFLENHEGLESDSENEQKSNLLDETIYFPKKYNDEQIEIIEKARRNSKVLVQGPPGTGKSHTIANLICHLLANGKKVLVTAYTKRALEVLKNQLPPEFKNLTVNLLSGDSNSIQDLDASVNAINDELSRIVNLNNNRKEIKEKEKELAGLKEKKTSTKNDWLKIKEGSTRRQYINSNYQGTLSEIAETLEKEIPIFTWFKDDFIDFNKSNLIADLENFYYLTRNYQNIDCNIFNLIIPNKEKLLSVLDLKEYNKIEDELDRRFPSDEKRIPIISKVYPDIKNQLQQILKLCIEIDNNISPLKSTLLSDHRNNLADWKDKLSRTTFTLSDHTDDELRNFDRSVEIQYPPDKSWKKLKSDAKVLLSYLNEGNSFSGIMFSLKKALLPKDIKEKLYFMEQVKVNGSPCDTITEFKTVLTDIKTKQDFEELEAIWGIKPNRNSKSYYEIASFYRKLGIESEILISLIDEANKIIKQIESDSSVKIQDYDKIKIQDLINEIDYSFLLTKKISFNERIIDTKKHLSSRNIHAISIRINEALDNLDVDNYEQLLSEIDTLISENEKYNTYKILKDKLSQHFPIIVQEMLDNTFEFSNLRQVENATYFKHASAEISNFLDEDYETKLLCNLSDLERQEEKLISTIASKKAWLFVLESLNENFLLRQHLQAWVQAVKKIGKTGTGKRALKFRKEAQQQMEKCKDSVPCWIMPLYKVAETINPEMGMYDYVIIDEASQLGADAIFLLYISKNIIIVGDDKQTSPEYVGVDANTMTPHINRYLHDIPFANYYGTEFSFFDHAKRFCKGMTVLREHFRCMPEIIEFCNKYFYAPDGKGLYPLKQYSENRIEPLKTVYCQNGYVDGSYQNITNRVEAEAIANKMAILIADQRYKGKSFGVIGLQGNKQATIIENLIIKKIGEVEYKKRNIVCGTSASFQGDERDIMFLSLVTAINHNRAALTKPEDERRFNVAVSRAKEQVWLFHSIQLEDLSNNNDLRYKLLDHFLNYRPQPIPIQKTFERKMGTQPDPFESWFEVDVYNDIVAKNYSVIPQYEVAKGRYRIDLVTLLSNGVKIAIECDGDKYHSADEFQNDLMRQKVLERCGWQFFRVKGADYYSNRIKALQPLWKLLSSNDSNSKESELTINSKTIDNKPNVEFTDSSHPEKSVPFEPAKATISEQFDNEIQSDVDSKNVVSTISTPIKISDDSNSKEILVYTSFNNVYKVQRREINDRMQALERIEFESGEKPIYLTGDKSYSGFLIVAFENGKIGKISMNSYRTEHNRKKLKNAFNDESKLIFIERIDDDIDLITLSNINKVVLFNTSQINPVESRNTKGVQVMKQKSGSLMLKVKRPAQAKLSEPEYYRKSECLNVVGYYLKQGDEI